MKTQQFIYQVDAFSTEPFKGNPAAVYICEMEPSVSRMQNIAMEMNLSETAFVFPGNDCWLIRFFTPESEVPLCGHATLSASHVMYETNIVKTDEAISFISKKGELKIRKSENWITMNFPAYNVNKIAVPAIIKQLIGVEPLEFYKSAYGWNLALLDNEKMVRELKPDFGLMKKSEFGDLIVTASSEESEYDFCVRCFAPLLGINEDPVTGSAHCSLVPFWHMKTGKTEFISHQVSRRTGVLRVSLKEDRVEISGQAVTILKAEMFV